jgi:hypothetical protein
VALQFDTEHVADHGRARRERDRAAQVDDPAGGQCLLQRRLDKVPDRHLVLVDRSARESGVDELAQLVMTGRIGRAQGPTGACRAVVDEVSLGRGEGLGVAQRGEDVAVAAQRPRLRRFGPKDWMLVAHGAVQRERIRRRLGRVGIEHERCRRCHHDPPGLGWRPAPSERG